MPPTPSPRLVQVPGFCRVRELAKLLGVNLKEVLRETCVRNKKRYYMGKGADAYEFHTVKSVIVPFARAEQIAKKLGREVRFFDLRHEVRQELQRSFPLSRSERCPVVAVLGHVAHGKTSMIAALNSDPSITRRVAFTSSRPRDQKEITQMIETHSVWLAPPAPPPRPQHRHALAEGSAAAAAPDDAASGPSFLFPDLGLDPVADLKLRPMPFSDGGTSASDGGGSASGGAAAAVATFIDTPGHYHFFRMRNDRWERTNPNAREATRSCPRPRTNGSAPFSLRCARLDFFFHV
jgi:hypothetical protein